jgi:hypothetical protein
MTEQEIRDDERLRLAAKANSLPGAPTYQAALKHVFGDDLNFNHFGTASKEESIQAEPSLEELYQARLYHLFYGLEADQPCQPVRIKGPFTAQTLKPIGTMIPTAAKIIARAMSHNPIFGNINPENDRFEVWYSPDGVTEVTANVSADHIDMSDAYANARKALLAYISTEDLQHEVFARSAGSFPSFPYVVPLDISAYAFVNTPEPALTTHDEEPPIGIKRKSREGAGMANSVDQKIAAFRVASIPDGEKDTILPKVFAAKMLRAFGVIPNGARVCVEQAMGPNTFEIAWFDDLGREHNATAKRQDLDLSEVLSEVQSAMFKLIPTDALRDELVRRIEAEKSEASA